MVTQPDTESFLSFFGLREQPFAATADPAYFYVTSGHKECLFRLWNTIDEQQGIAVILGHYGTGKTTLLRKLLTGMRAKPKVYNTIVIASPIPSWTSFSLLSSIVTQCGLQPERNSFVSCMEAFYKYLLTNRDRINTLIVDDSQNLNRRGQLELLRLLQNLETPQRKLINMVFFSQIEWTDVLRAAPNFLQRVNLTYTLEPLTLEETGELISFRLRQAGAGSRGPVLDPAAIRAIYTYSEGSPRVTITLCRNALLLAAHIKTRQIGQAIVLHTIQKTTLPDPEKMAKVAIALQQYTSKEESIQSDQDASLSLSESRQAINPNEEKANRLLLKSAKANTEKLSFTDYYDTHDGQ